jgi:hypothetical protein
MNMIREDPVNPNVLSAAVTFGVYLTTNGGAGGDVPGGNLPSVAVMDFIVHARDRMLVIATHGHGVTSAVRREVLAERVRPRKAAAIDLLEHKRRGELLRDRSNGRCRRRGGTDVLLDIGHTQARAPPFALALAKGVHRSSRRVLRAKVDRSCCSALRVAGHDSPSVSYSVRNAIVGSMLSARRVGTTHASMQTPSMTIP